jgi:hypothetical protein
MYDVEVDTLSQGIAQTQSNIFFGILDQLLFDPTRWWWLEVTPLMAYSSTFGRKWIRVQEAFFNCFFYKLQVEKKSITRKDPKCSRGS